MIGQHFLSIDSPWDQLFNFVHAHTEMRVKMTQSLIQLVFALCVKMVRCAVQRCGGCEGAPTNKLLLQIYFNIDKLANVFQAIYQKTNVNLLLSPVVQIIKQL